MPGPAAIAARVPPATIEWLTAVDNPAVSVLAQRLLLGLPADDEALTKLWAKRNQYEPVRRILDAERPDGTWVDPDQDYQKYRGNLWQVAFLGELWADPSDERVGQAIAYAFSRQHESGAWGSGPQPATAAPCLTANVGRALARLGYSKDERVLRAISWLADQHRELGFLGCKGVDEFTINGYCHMYAPKVLLFLGQVERGAWPAHGARTLRDACVAALAGKEVFRCLPKEFSAFQDEVWSAPARERAAARERFIARHSPIEYRDKPGWLRFGFPLHYNSDALEALLGLAAVGEPRRPEFEAALAAVRDAADAEMRWALRTTLNGKMVADVEDKGQPSKWLTLRALTVLEHFGEP